MGEISGNNVDIHQAQAGADNDIKFEPEQIKTDVEDVFADGEKQIGKEKFPVFNVDRNSFYQNMTHGRKRLRFQSGSPAQKYMQGTKYNRPFFISYKSDKGEVWTRKIK